MQERWFITQWALTKGIISIPRDKATVTEHGYLSAGSTGFFGHKNYSGDLVGAMAQAEVKRQRALKAAERQLARLREYSPVVHEQSGRSRYEGE